MFQTNNLKEIRSLGEGGFGTTTLVERDGKRYVLKRLKSSAIEQHGNAAIDLFVQESEYLRKLGDHPQIPALIDAGMDSTPWILQEYIPGNNLEQILAQQRYFSEAEVIALLKSMLPVLQAVHESGAIHRDIKPANIIFANEQYHLVDFGASKKVSETVLAKTGTVIGSAIYSAPEQMRGRAEFASDIYSLGVTCIHLLTGLPPMELMSRTEAGLWCWRDFLVEGRAVSEGLGRILDRMLEYGLHRRYGSANDVLADLARIDRFVVRSRRQAWVKKARRARFASRLVKRSGTYLIYAAVAAATVWAGAGLIGFLGHTFSGLGSIGAGAASNGSVDQLVAQFTAQFKTIGFIVSCLMGTIIATSSGIQIIQNADDFNPSMLIVPLFMGLGLPIAFSFAVNLILS